jgi:hypothetical protein
MYVAEFDPTVILKDSNVDRIMYGSTRYDKVYYEYATINYSTVRDVTDPEPDENYYNVLRTMVNASFTGGNVVYVETT